MNFQDLKTVENPDFYIDLAFRRAKEKAEVIKKSKLHGMPYEKARYTEKLRISTIAGVISSRMQQIIESFPSIDQLPDFYRELISITLDYAMLKKSLGAVNWLDKRISKLSSEFERRISKSEDPKAITKLRNEFYGRASSLVKQIKEPLKFLENSRKTMREFPTVKTSVFTVALCGFPNVGKTTLLYKLTGSKPEINSYAFTTKGINVSYIRGEEKIQFLDTPGTLNRPEKMNRIEKQAYLAMDLVADIFVYVFDLTGESYPVEKQMELYETVKKMKKPMIIYLSKSDLLDKEVITKFKKKMPSFDDSKVLQKEIMKFYK